MPSAADLPRPFQRPPGNSRFAWPLSDSEVSQRVEIAESPVKRAFRGVRPPPTESGLIQRALDTVAAFFRWLGSIAEQLDEMTRWMLVVRCAFRRILLPDPALKPLLALK